MACESLSITPPYYSIARTTNFGRVFFYFSCKKNLHIPCNHPV